MTVSELMTTLSERGYRLEAQGNRLRYHPAEIPPELRELLIEHKAEVLELLKAAEARIAWRVEAMLRQIPDSGPIPFLVARKDFKTGPNCCHSCGDSLNGGSGYLCGPCSRAKHRALEIAIRKRRDAVIN